MMHQITLMTKMTTDNSKRCPDCGVEPGQLHEEGCDVERSPVNGLQMLMHGNEENLPRIPWSGEWPGKAECKEYDWWIAPIGDGGWYPCKKDDPSAMHDLSRLYRECVWNKELQRFVKK